jgi:DNA-binding transcriptional ArsR family regulator
MVDCRRHLASSGIDRDHRDRFTGLAAIMRPAAAGTPIGDPLGIAFFATMHRAYLHTPGVEMTGCFARPNPQGLRSLADESRRTLLEALSSGPASAGELAALVPIARPGVSRHLRVLREAGLVEVRREAQRRVYGLRPEPLAEVDEWLGRYRALWEQRLDALHTGVARGKRERRSTR